MGVNILALLHVSFSLVRSMFSFIAFSGFFSFFYVLVLVHLLGYPFVYCLSLFFLFSRVHFWDRSVCVVFLCLYSTFSIHHFAVGFFIIAAFFSLPTGSFLFFFFTCFTFFSLPPPTAFVVFLRMGHDQVAIASACI